jgi:very-short-patch-repair endonuclease
MRTRAGDRSPETATCVPGSARCVPDTPDDRLRRFADEHHGLYRVQDARVAGLTPTQISRRVRQGRAERMGRGVYRFAGAPRTYEQSLLAATWRTNGVASHRSAAALHGLLPTDGLPVEVTVPRSGSHVHEGLVVHRHGDLSSARLVSIAAIRTTGPARTLVDIGSVIGGQQLERLVHGALHRRLTTIDRLVEEYRAVTRPGRNGTGPIGQLLRELDPTMGPAESDLEVLLLSILDEFGLPPPVRQYVVEVVGRTFRLDAAYPDHKVFLEGDGFGVHGTRNAFEDDRWRQNLLVVAGWRPLRFTWRQLHGDRIAVAGQVRSTLGL